MTARAKSPHLLLPGIIASIFSVAVGLVALLTALNSFGRQSEYGYLISPAAGGVLFIILGLAGALGAASYLWRQSISKWLIILTATVALFGLLIFAHFGEWLGCILLIVIMASVLYAYKRERGNILLLYSGLTGFPVAQLAITTLPYGWKTWAIPGVLFLFAGLAIILEGYSSILTRMPGRKVREGNTGHILYAALSLIIILSSIALLMHVPAQAGPGEEKFVPRSSPNTSYEGDCNCSRSAPADATPPLSNQNCQEGQVEIILPEDVRTFSQGESILFHARACGSGPRIGLYQYLWWSNRDGILESLQNFSSSNLTPGWHTITLSVTDDLGRNFSDSIELTVAPPSVCSNVTPRPRYYPPDSPCQDIWPGGSRACQEIEVCHPGLDYIVVDAVRCCNGSDQTSPACIWARAHAGEDNKRCRGLYIIRAFGPDAVYMQGYALFKACCSGYPECTRTSWPSLAGTCSFREGFNRNVQNLSCRKGDWGVEAWRSDTDMSKNSAVLGLFPAHATINILQTGVCVDYAAALTTALRKAGYGNREAMIAASQGYDLPLLGEHPGHAYNLVKLPGDDGYHIVDTTGNAEGINLDGLPHYFWFTGNFMNQPVRIRVFDWWTGYCSKISPHSYNDLGSIRTPENSNICGCSE